MKVRLFGCRKYRRVYYAQRDRALNPAENLFLKKHGEVCPLCAKGMQVGSLALNMLRSEGVLDAEVAAGFNERIVRRVEIDNKRLSLRYWSPAVMGAAVAGLVVLAAMQMIAQSSQLPSFKVPSGEARLSKPAIPDLQSFDFHRSWQ